MPGSVLGLGQRSQRVSMSLDTAFAKNIGLQLEVFCQALKCETSPIAAEGDPSDAVWQNFGTLVAELLYKSGWSVRRDFRWQAKYKGPRSVAVMHWPALHIAPLDDALPTIIELLQNSGEINQLEGMLAQIGAIQEAMRAISPYQTGVNSAYLDEAAAACRIPNRMILGNLVLGIASKQKTFQSTLTNETPYLATTFASDKSKTAALLRMQGLPAPEHRFVKSAEQAVSVARAFGYPVVIKPADKDRGAGVMAGLQTDQQVASAYHMAREISSRILVERWVPGFTHRFMVVNGQVLRVVRRRPGGVVGDGEASIQELVQRQLQSSSMREGLLHNSQSQVGLSLDGEALALLDEQGFSVNSVPPDDMFVRLRRRDNISAGGSNVNLDHTNSQEVHPDNLQLAIDATKAIGLDIAGVDVIAEDVAISWRACAACICEINVKPQMSGRGDPQRYRKFLQAIGGGDWSVPVELFLVPERPEQFNDALTSILSQEIYRLPGVGVSSKRGLWVAGRQVSRPFNDNFAAAAALFLRKDIERCLYIMTPRELLTFGLPLAPIEKIKPAPKSHFSGIEQSKFKTIRKWLELDKQFYSVSRNGVIPASNHAGKY